MCVAFCVFPGRSQQRAFPWHTGPAQRIRQFLHLRVRPRLATNQPPCASYRMRGGPKPPEHPPISPTHTTHALTHTSPHKRTRAHIMSIHQAHHYVHHHRYSSDRRASSVFIHLLYDVRNGPAASGRSGSGSSGSGSSGISHFHLR